VTPSAHNSDVTHPGIAGRAGKAAWLRGIGVCAATCQNTKQITLDLLADHQGRSLAAQGTTLLLQVCFSEAWLLTPFLAGLGEEGDRNDLCNSC